MPTKYKMHSDEYMAEIQRQNAYLLTMQLMNSMHMNISEKTKAGINRLLATLQDEIGKDEITINPDPSQD